ncbi:MAG: hypothetical protein H6R18_2212 [Proteobacteria bacterium]|nr:hypothetical protein [Pseudomonadota bacterium]
MHKIVFSGKILPGHDPAMVRDKLLSMLGLPPDQAERLFCGKPRVLKKELSAEEAKRYLDHLAKRGIAVDIDPPLKAASNSSFPTLIIDAEPEAPVEEAPKSAVPSTTAEPCAKPVPLPVKVVDAVVSPAAPTTASLAAAPITLLEPELKEVICPKCGEAQPKRTLCRACSTDMPRFAAAQQEAAIESRRMRIEETAVALSSGRFASNPKDQSRCHVAPKITPFWERLPKFFLFPLQTSNLITLILLSLSSLLAFFLPLPSPFDHLLVQCLIMLAGVRRAFVKMDAMSRGYLGEDEQALMPSDPQRVNLPWKLLGVMIVWGIVVNIVGSISVVLGYLVWAFASVTLPAAVMALSVTNSFFSGLNPALWVRIIRGVGKPYAALFVFLTLLSGGTSAILPLLAPLLRGWYALPIIDFSFLYFIYVMFAMMGYVLYQYHWELGVQVDRVHSEASGAAVQDDAGGDLIAQLIANGDIDAALAAAHEQHLAEPEDLKVQERYHKLLLMAEKNDRAVNHGRKYLSLLLQKKQGDSAVALFRRMREIEPAFKPVHPEEFLKLAVETHRCRQYEAALALMDGFEQKYPGNADIAPIHFLTARIQSEVFRRDDIARQILGALCERFPGHAMVVSEVAPYLRALDAIRQGAAG